MRLDAKQKQQIFSCIPSGVQVFVFGSRLDDNARGGDVDLIIQSKKAITLDTQHQIKHDLEEKLYLPFDILFIDDVKELSSFEKMAKFDAVEITMQKTKHELTIIHLKDNLEVIERGVYFLSAINKTMNFPLSENLLLENKNDVDLFTKLSALNERFSKLQDTLTTAMRHCVIVLEEKSDRFLKILAFFEKNKVIKDMNMWKSYRDVRNSTAHDYAINYTQITNHFNEIFHLSPFLINDAKRFISFCNKEVNL